MLVLLSASAFAEDISLEGMSDAEINSLLNKTASDLNKQLPMMVDSETRLDSSIGLNKSFKYNYTMVNYKAEEVNRSEFNKIMQPRLVNMVCTTKELDVFTKNGIPVTYNYYGKNGKNIATITVSPSQCEHNR